MTRNEAGAIIWQGELYGALEQQQLMAIVVKRSHMNSDMIG